jgi:hypothetical protein
MRRKGAVSVSPPRAVLSPFFPPVRARFWGFLEPVFGIVFALFRQSVFLGRGGENAQLRVVFFVVFLRERGAMLTNEKSFCVVF